MVVTMGWSNLLDVPLLKYNNLDFCPAFMNVSYCSFISFNGSSQVPRPTGKYQVTDQ